MIKKVLKNGLLTGSGTAAAGLAGFKLAGLEFTGSGTILVLIVAIICVTLLIALHLLTTRTDFTAILTSWATRKLPESTKKSDYNTDDES